jgi:hypothetical protein
VSALNLGPSSFNRAFDKRCALDLRKVRFIVISDAIVGGAAHHATVLRKVDINANPLQLIDEEQDLRMIPAQAIQRTYHEHGCFTIPQALERVGKLRSVERSASFNIAVDRDEINPDACRIFLDRRTLAWKTPGASLTLG